MDTYGLQALWHMKTHGTTQSQIAFAASKNHFKRFNVDPETVRTSGDTPGPPT